MQSMILSFNAIFPLLAFMMLGFFLKNIKLLTEEAMASLNKLVFNVLLPANILNNIYKADIRGDFNLKVAIYAALLCISSFLIVNFFVNPREKDRTVAPVVIQGMSKSNYNLLVVSIASSFCGTELGMSAILVMVTSPIVNTLSTIAFETARGKNVSVIHLCKRVILNPLVLSSIVAVILNLIGIRFPTVIENGVIARLFPWVGIPSLLER